MKKIIAFGILGFMVLSMLAFSGGFATATTGTSTNKIYIPYVNFNVKDINYNGKADENGFFTFSITTASGIVINVAWRQNGVDLHAVLTTTNPGWVALGWHNSTPASTSGSGPMIGANIIIGGNKIARDDTGAAGTHSADTVDNIINYSSTVTSKGAAFEFTFPLASPDPVDQALTVKSWGYFIFATGTSATNLAAGHDGSLQAMYVPNVYIESSAKEGYKSPSKSSPFADPAIIVISIGLLAIITKVKRRNK